MTPEIREPGSRKAKGGLVAGGAGALLIASLLASALGEVPECEVTFEPHVVPARGHPVLIHAIPTRPVPEIDGLGLPAESGLVAAPTRLHPHRFLVNPVEAAEGDWRLTLRSGGVDVCSGSLTVGPRRLPELAPRLAQDPSPRPR